MDEVWGGGYMRTDR